MSSSTFQWGRRRHAAACTANIPLVRSDHNETCLNELVLLFDAAAVPSEPAGKGKMQLAYGKAIDSIAKYPLEITSPEEAQELAGIGDFLASRIGRILQKLGVEPAVHDVIDQPPPPPAPSPKKKAKKHKPSDAPAAGVVGSSSIYAAVSSSGVPVRAPTLPPAASVPPILPSLFSDAPRPESNDRPAGASSSSAPLAFVDETGNMVFADANGVLPECPFGELCYRTKPEHFLEQRHPKSHPLAVIYSPPIAVATSAPKSNKRAYEEVILLDDDDDEEDTGESPQKKLKTATTTVASSAAAPPRKPAPRPKKRKSDDFLDSDDEDEDSDDVCDLTLSPPPPAIAPTAAPKFNRATSTPAASSSNSLPPPHPSAPTAAASWTLPQAPTAELKPDKTYKPKPGTSAHALLIALFHTNSPLNKSQCLDAAIAHYPSDKAASDSDAMRTTLWSGMSNLVTRDLVNKALTPVVYSLTPLGRETVQKMIPRSLPPPRTSPPPDDFLSTPSPAPSHAAASSSSPLISAAAGHSSSISATATSSSHTGSLQPMQLARRFCNGFDWEVVMLIDVRERSGRKDAAYMIEKLGKRGLICEARALSVGDFQWLARHKANKSLEVVLDSIIERKRVGDLVSSIRDGRYHEQRSRLKKTNLTRMIYVIEGRVAEDTVHGLPLKTVETVITSMNGVHGMLVHHTPSIEATISFLESLHRLLETEIHEAGCPVVLPQTVPYQPFPMQQLLPSLAELPAVPPSLFGVGESFASFTARLHKSANLLAAELFGTQLRMIRGVSASLAMNILAKYPSARALYSAYEQCTNEEAEENMLEDISRGPHQSE